MGGGGGGGRRESAALEIELRCSSLRVVRVVPAKGSPPPLAHQEEFKEQYPPHHIELVQTSMVRWAAMSFCNCHCVIVSSNKILIKNPTIFWDGHNSPLSPLLSPLFLTLLLIIVSRYRAPGIT